MRRAARVDRNQTEIVAAFRAMRCSVTPTHQVGQGFPDLVVGVAGRNLLVEIKDGNKPPSGRKLTPDEMDWHDAWLGSVHIIKSTSEVETLVNNIRTGRVSF